MVDLGERSDAGGGQRQEEMIRHLRASIDRLAGQVAGLSAIVADLAARSGLDAESAAHALEMLPAEHQTEGMTGKTPREAGQDLIHRIELVARQLKSAGPPH